jgi:archaellum component FlaF (FlaF/FlaG flagellin family)
LHGLILGGAVIVLTSEIVVVGIIARTYIGWCSYYSYVRNSHRTIRVPNDNKLRKLKIYRNKDTVLVKGHD